MVELNSLRPGLLAVLLLAGACDGGASAVPARDHAAAGPPGLVSAASSTGAGATADPRQAPAPKINGRPMWSANRRFTAEQNARRHFERNGAAFGATTVEAYVARAHAFVSDPPGGAQTLTRANGDRLIYDPRNNVFAVATREGAPRIMFKPDDGAAYWDRVKAREAEGGARRKRSEDDRS